MEWHGLAVNGMFGVPWAEPQRSVKPTASSSFPAAIKSFWEPYQHPGEAAQVMSCSGEADSAIHKEKPKYTHRSIVLPGLYYLSLRSP